MWWMVCDELLWTESDVAPTTGMIRRPCSKTDSAYTGLMGKRNNKRKQQKYLSNSGRELEAKAKQAWLVDELISDGLASDPDEARRLLRENRRRPKWKPCKRKDCDDDEGDLAAVPV
jgi:hypothetical protein